MFDDRIIAPKVINGINRNSLCTRVLDKREYLMIFFSYFSSKPYVVTPHLNRLVQTVQMRGHNICSDSALTIVIPNYRRIVPFS